MSLSWRLILSYTLIIFVTLTLAFGTLILISRPLQNRFARTRLVAQSQQVALQVNDLYRQGVATEEILGQLNRWIGQNRTRLIFMDNQGIVLADSQGDWMGQQLPLPSPADGSPLSLRSAGVEIFNDPNRGAFMYAALPVGRPDEQAGYVATVAPRASDLPGLMAELGWGFVAAGLVALLLSLFVGVLIARSIALPLQRVARAAGAVAAGDYEHRLPETGPPEIKRVAASFNVMMGQVEDSQRAIRDFVSNVSHELKTPLTSIQGFSQAIMEGATPDEAAQQRAARIIHQEANRMARMVEDLLDLARIDSGQIVMQKTPLDLAQILTSASERLLPQAAQKQVTVLRQWGTSLGVVGDGDRLAQVFTNLLDNAMRHTSTGGRVTISSQIVKGLPRPQRLRAGLIQPDASTALSKRSDFVEVNIVDTGPGIPPDDLARVFERFYQVDKSRKRGRGTGLGLAITKEIVEAHGGYVRVENVGGGGAKFIVLLPLTEADAATLISSRKR